MADNTRDKLGQLRIDRSAGEPEGGGGWLWPAIAGVAVLVALALGGYVVMGGGAGLQTATNASAPSAASGGASAPGAAASGTTTPGGGQASGQGAAAPAAAPARAAGVLSASGYVVARRLATVSAEITGRVSEVLVEEGMRVEAGQIVARLDPTLAKIDLAADEAEARAAAADAVEAEQELRRLRGLTRGTSVSEADLTRAEARAASARARADLATESVRRQMALLYKYDIRAPFTGVVTARAAQVGEIIAPGSAGGGFTRTGICTIVDMDSLEVEVDVNEAFISRVTPGQPVRATLDAYPEWDIPASVIAIIPTADRSRATVKVRIRLEQKDARILPDMAAKVTFLDPAARTGAATQTP